MTFEVRKGNTTCRVWQGPCSLSGGQGPPKRVDPAGNQTFQEQKSCVFACLNQTFLNQTFQEQKSCVFPCLNQTFQEQKRSSAAFVPLESPRREWPCTFFVQPALGGSRSETVRWTSWGGARQATAAPRRPPKSWLGAWKLGFVYYFLWFC